ncbi:MAG TPA: ABC transporter permease [Candidatus Fimimorpha faecalis]|uniref:Cell division protein FtsX n=1 Tax=Candidatus Fimimorpha faecalis TaxID=2840824 RepID=A0A9D1JDK5_9FIRM|nr:ABC transporter permease [Candidatus Fimimorpha faecalis]
MKLNTIGYCLKQGIGNIKRNKMFSVASVITIVVCIFLFGLFYAILANFQYMLSEAENTVGVTVFFEDNMKEKDILSLKEELEERDDVKTVDYVTEEDAWNEFKEIYFAEMPELAEGFEGENPLVGSASFEIYLKDLSKQKQLVAELEEMEGIRKVTYSELAAGGLEDMQSLVGWVSLFVTGVLFIISVFLISNSITLSYTVREKEMHTMKWLGATNLFVKAPFIIEGLLLGLIGTVIPLLILYFFYKEIIVIINERFSILSNVLKFLSVKQVFQILLPVSLLLGEGIGFIGSFFTIRRHLKV